MNSLDPHRPPISDINFIGPFASDSSDQEDEYFYELFFSSDAPFLDKSRSTSALGNGFIKQRSFSALDKLRMSRVENSPPIEERVKSFILATIPLFRDVFDHSERSIFLKTLQKIPECQRTSFFRGISFDKFERKAVFLKLHGMSKNHLSNVCQKASELAEGALHVFSRIPALSIVDKAFKMQRDVMIQEVKPLLTQMTQRYVKDVILEAAEMIPSARKEAFIANATSHAQKTLKKNWEMPFVEILRNMPEEKGREYAQENESFIQETLSLLINITEQYARETILRAVGLVPEDQRGNIVTQALSSSRSGVGISIRAAILEAFYLIPDDQRTEAAFQALFSLFRNEPQRERNSDAVGVPDLIPESRRAAVVEASAPLIQGLESEIDRAYVFKAVYATSEIRRKAAVSMTIPFVQGISSGFERALIFEAVYKIPEERRIASGEQISPLLQAISDASGRIHILEAVHAIPAGRRVDFIEKANRLLQVKQESLSIEDGCLLMKSEFKQEYEKQMLSLLRRVSKDLKDDIVSLTVSLLRESTDLYERGALLGAVASVRKEYRTETLYKNLVDLLFQDVIDGDSREIRLSALRTIPESQRTEEVCFGLATLFKGISDRDLQRDILCVIREIPKERRSEAIIDAVSLMGAVNDVAERILFLYALSIAFQGVEGQSFVSAVCESIRTISNKNVRAACFKIYWEMPNRCRSEECFSKVVALLQTIRNDEFEHAGILEIIKTVPEAARTEATVGKICEFLTKVVRGSKDNRLSVDSKKEPNKSKTNPLLGTFNVIPESLRSEENLLRFVDILEKIKGKSGREYFFEAMSAIKEDQRTGDFLEAIFSLFRGVCDEYEIKALRNFIKTMPAQQRASLILSVYSSLNEPANGYAKVELLKKATVAHFSGELERFIADAKESRRIAAYIVERQDDLGLHPEHNLLQRAIHIYCVTDPTVVNDPKNPYLLYENLSKLTEEEAVWGGPVPSFSTGDLNVSVDVSTLRAGSRGRIFTRGDLPAGISADGFNELFNRLEERIHSSEGAAIEGEINKIYEKPFGELKDNVVNQQVIPGLLLVTNEPDRQISNSTFYLYMILRAISSFSNERTRTKCLSAQESALLNFAYAVCHCRTGQIDGIAQFYNYLPLEFRMHENESVRTEGGEKVVNFINISVQQALNEVFTDDHFIGALTNQGKQISQKAHQTLYLKNRMYKQVGLRHQPTFDLHSSTVHNSLFSAPLSALMKRFFEYCTPEKLVSRLRYDLNLALKEPNSGLYLPMADLLELEVPRQWTNYFSVDEISQETKISRNGALMLLKVAKYLKST